jgi:hypothetical protein
MRLLFHGFRGENRALHPKLLPDTVGTVSRNANPVRGDLRPWRAPLAVATVPGGRNTIYRMGRDVASDALYWLSWTGIVHAVRGLIADDTSERTYYTGDGVPKWTDNTIALASGAYPTAWRQLGVPAPTAAMMVGTLVGTLAAGTSTTSETRFYTYTFVTSLGEESAPAPVSTAWYGPDDSTLTLGNLGPAPSGAFLIDRIRIYRTQSGQAGATEFYFLRELGSTQTTTTDDGRSLGEVLPTDGWLPPPAGLHTLTGMWNGMLAGISGNAVRYSVAYKPYAWPVAFETLPADAKPVSLAVFGQRLLVLTTGRPVLVSGTSPDSLDEQPLEISQSCVAPRATVAFGHGVAWACPDGLAYFGEGGAKLLTNGLLTREDWQAMHPETMVAGMYEGAYLCFFDDVDGARRGFLLDPMNPTGLYFLDVGYSAIYFDRLQDALYILDGTAIKKWDASTALMTARYVTKTTALPMPFSFSWGKVAANGYPVTLKLNALELEASEIAQHVAAFPGRCVPHATGVQFTLQVPSAQAFRLPAIPARAWQFDLTTAQPVQGLAVAQSIDELRG